MLITLLRHGETVYNAARRYQGSRDIPLSPVGRAALFPAEFAPKTVYITPLLRTAETARLLFPHAALEVIPALGEMQFGSFEGRSAYELRTDPDYLAWVAADCVPPCPGGESREGFSRRTCEAFARLVNQALAAGEERLTIVAHGGTQMAVLERYALPRRDYYTGCAKNGCGFLLDTAPWRETGQLLLTGEVCYAKGGDA
ncbi:MAG: histidine phosphatase family protein [Oscillospiraceae bacterium]